jgi:SAP domain
MALYARSDVMSVSVPIASGGCGSTHSRPVHNGAPARDFELICAGCENFLKGGGRQVLRQNPIDKETRTGGELRRVTDVDPQWSATPDSVPDTPDESTYTSKRDKLGREQLEWVRAVAAAKEAGLDLPPEAVAMLNRRLPNVLGGNGQSVIEAPKYGLDDLSTEKLKAIAKSQGLPTSGSRAQLIERLS